MGTIWPLQNGEASQFPPACSSCAYFAWSWQHTVHQNSEYRKYRCQISELMPTCRWFIGSYAVFRIRSSQLIEERTVLYVVVPSTVFFGLWRVSFVSGLGPFAEIMMHSPVRPVPNRFYWWLFECCSANLTERKTISLCKEHPSNF